METKHVLLHAKRCAIRCDCAGHDRVVVVEGMLWHEDELCVRVLHDRNARALFWKLIKLSEHVLSLERDQNCDAGDNVRKEFKPM